MHDILLIHHDDVPLETEMAIKFDATSPVDDYICTVILEKMRVYTPKAIFIKDSLSHNYLDLYGLRVTHHIRLCAIPHLRDLPIVILSDLDSHYLNKLSKQARILFTQNTHIIPNKQKDIQEKIQTLHSQEIDHVKFLETIVIEKPEQSSNHDIANEWAIYRWAEFLGAQSPAIEQNNTKIANALFFKHIKAKFAIGEEDRHVEIKPINKKGKILYIDDEYQKGWGDIVQKLLSRSDKVSLTCYKGSFENKINLIRDIKTKIKSSAYDVVLLDMRLTETDHKAVDDMASYSGIKIADAIKSINPGIQVIMITASAKSKSLEKLSEYGILGYIQKENPYQAQLTTAQDIQKLHELIDTAFERKYLKEVWRIQEDILGLEVFEKELYELKDIVHRVFDILNSDIADKEVFAGLTIFKCIEIIIGFYIEERTSKGANGKRIFEKYWRGSDEKIEVSSIQDKIEAIFDSKFKTTYKSISKDMKHMVDFRNNTIHGGRDHAIKKPTSQHLITWLKMLQKILKNIDATHD